MPFANNSELPKGVRDSLPAGAQSIWRGAFNGSLNGECKGDDTCASKIAWSAVEKKYKKNADGKWVAKADLVDQFSLVITKAAYDKSSGEMRFSATASDTEKDLREQRMSLELFRDFIRRATTNMPAPEMFQSDFWKGGMPYMSVSHYPDMNGKAVPGIVQSLYIDGNRLKAKGILFDTPLGRACWRAICESLYSSPPVPDDDKVRISIAFLDWKHAHGNMMFERKSIEEFCPACMENTGDKVYLAGQLVHLAFTRVPCNPRADVEVELSMSAKTQLEDAESIVGKDLADEIEEEKQKAFVSEALVIKSETEEEAPVEEDETETEEEVEVEEASARKDVSPADKKRATKEYGNVKYADETNKKYPIDTEEHIRAAWSYIHMPRNQKKYSPAEVKTIEGKIAAAWRRVIDKEGPPAVKKGMIAMESLMEGEPAQYFPYDGAVTFEDAESYMEMADAMNSFYNDWGMFQTLAGNILNASDIEDKMGAMKSLVTEFRKRLDQSCKDAVKKMADYLDEEKKPAPAPHPLDNALSVLKAEFDTASSLKATKEEKLQAVQKSFSDLGEAIKANIPESETVTTEVVEPGPASLDVTTLKSAFSEALQPLLQAIQIQNEGIRQLQQTGAGAIAVDQTRQLIPARRSLNPALVKQSDLPVPAVKSETPKLRDIINKSVGIQ